MVFARQYKGLPTDPVQPEITACARLIDSIKSKNGAGATGDVVEFSGETPKFFVVSPLSCKPLSTPARDKSILATCSDCRCPFREGLEDTKQAK